YSLLSAEHTDWRNGGRIGRGECRGGGLRHTGTQLYFLPAFPRACKDKIYRCISYHTVIYRHGGYQRWWQCRASWRRADRLSLYTAAAGRYKLGWMDNHYPRLV